MLAEIKENIKSFPILTICLIIALCSIGIAMMYSAGGGNFTPYASKQLAYMIVFFICMIVISFIDLKLIFSYSYIFYMGSLLLLIAVELIGHKAMGATRWINLGFFKMQPSEIMKISMVLALSRYFHSLGELDYLRFKQLPIPILLIILPALVIMRQPDLGTAIILILVGGTVLFLAGVRVWKFLFVIAVIAISMPIIWTKLHDYQKKRIEIFLNPELDPLGSGYNIIQSKIAIGSGGIAGKGFTEGTQAQLDFLPEHQTDFVFPMFAEEFGYLGALILLGLYICLMFFGIKVSNHCRYIYGRLVSFGLISIFIFHVFINLCMVMGLMPVVGIPLPFMSYGGTIVGTTMLIFGIIINIYMNKKVTLPKSSVSYFF